MDSLRQDLVFAIGEVCHQPDAIQLFVGHGLAFAIKRNSREHDGLL